MKRWLASFSLALLAAGCGMPEDDLEANKRVTYPSIPDAAFEQYLLQEHDLNGDGRLSFYEAERVVKIDCAALGIASLAGVEYFTSLRELFCSENEIDYLDLRKNLRLERVNCSGNSIAVLEVGDLRQLYELDCSCNALRRLDLSSNPALAALDCSANELSLLDVGGCARRMSRVDALENPLELFYKAVGQQIVWLQIGLAEILER